MQAGDRAGPAARIAGAYIGVVAAFPRLALAALALLLALAGLGASHIAIDTDSSRMLAPDLPFQERAQAINAAFPQLKNQIVIAIRADRADPADLAAAQIAGALAGDPSVSEVFAPAADPFFERHGLLYLETDALEDRLTRLSKSANLLAALREDQTLGGFLAALDEAGQLAERADIPTDALDLLYGEAAAVIEATLAGRARGFAWTHALGEGEPVLRVVSVAPQLDFSRVNPAKAAMEAVALAVARVDPAVAAEVEIGVTGDPVLRAEELASVAESLPVSLALSLVIVAVVLWWGLRSVALMGVALVALVATLVLTTGLAGAAVGALNLVSVAFVVLMVGLGIDFAIHLVAHLQEDARSRPPAEALHATARALGPALLLTGASTSAAFFAFAFTDFRGMAQLGIIGGMGVIVALFVAVTLIPAVVALRPALLARAPAPGGLVARRARFPTGLRRGAAWLALAVGLAAAVLAREARFDADPMALRDPDARSVEVWSWLADDPSRAPLRLSLLAETEAAAREAAAALEAEPAVEAAVWLADLVPDDQEAKLALVDLAWPSLDFAVSGVAVDLAEDAPGGPAAFAETLGPDGAPGRLAAALAAYEAAADPALRSRLEAALFRYFGPLVDRLAAQLEVDTVTRESLPEALVERYRAPDGRLRVEIVAAENLSDPAERTRFVAAVDAHAPEAGGPPDQIAGAAEAISGAMLEASLVALAATALMAFAAVRRATVVAAILVPVALAGAVTLAATVLLGMPLNYANIIVLPLLIGIGVDSGVHLALRAQRAGAVFATSTPRAVAASALTTIGAFATLALSDHRGTASMGTLLAIALVAAVAMAFALTPPLVRLAGPTERPAGSR